MTTEHTPRSTLDFLCPASTVQARMRVVYYSPVLGTSYVSKYCISFALGEMISKECVVALSRPYQLTASICAVAYKQAAVAR